MSLTAADRAAVETLMRGTTSSAVEIAARTGIRVRTIRAWNRRFGWRPPRPGPAPTARHDLAGRDLNLALRDHIARQIARFDAALRSDPPPAIDSAKVLRDLGGLKRLLDDLSATDPSGTGLDATDNAGERRHATSGDGAGRLGDDRAGEDLPALRAAIAARYAACVGERADAGLPREPAAGVDPGPGLRLAP